MFKNWLIRSFNRRAAQENPDGILRAIGDMRGKTVGDIGSGGGYYVLKFSAAVGEQGLVLAIDNDADNLSFVAQFAKTNGCGNVRTILTNQGELAVETASVDLFFSRNVFHHFPNPVDYFRQLRTYLREEGRLVIIDYKKTGGFNFVNLFGHYSDEQAILSAMAQAGYRHIQRMEILEKQTFNIFGKNKENRKGEIQ